MSDRILKRVLYIHHSRLADRDLVFLFKDPSICNGDELVRSSAIKSLRRYGSSFGNSYVITTESSDYLVQMSLGRADHLAMELSVSL